MPEKMFCKSNGRSADGKKYIPEYTALDEKLSDGWTEYYRHDTAITKKALIELLEGKRKQYTFPDKVAENCSRSGRNALIDELIKEIKQ